MEETDALPDEAGSIPVVTSDEPPSKRRALSIVKRELSDDDLNHPGVQKLLIDELEKAESYCSGLERFRDKFYAADRDLAVAKADIERLTSHDILRSGVLGVGSLMLGYLPSSFGNWGLTALLSVGGVVLIGVSLHTKPRAK